jgi:hypothetical protein
MRKIDWKSKLTSRKFWLALTAFISLLVLAFGGTQEIATRITSIIMAGASVFAYIIGEGLVDAASVGSQTSTSQTTDSSTGKITNQK